METEMITKNQLINEITSSSKAGGYNTKIVMVPQDWSDNLLKPFGIPVSPHKDPEVAYDAMDGEITTNDAEYRDEQIDIISKIITRRREEEDVQNDDSGGNITEQVWPNNFIIEKNINEDLRVWFGTKKKPKGSSQPKGPWVNICRKDENGKHPPCGREKATNKSYPKCRAAGVAGKMSDTEKKAACRQKRRVEKDKPKTGTGNKPTMVSHKKKLIDEGVTDIVYHFTNIYSLNGILKSNRFLTKLVLGYKQEEKINRGRFFFLSTTRSKSEGFFKETPGSVRIKLDGRKLSQKYKGYPIDYWGASNLYTPEMEDRIVLDKPYIDNAIYYILEISILNDKSNKKIIKSVITLCEKNNIPVFLYDNISDYTMGNKNNALKINYLKGYDDELTVDNTTNKLDNPWDEKILKLISYKNPDVLSNYDEKTKENVNNINIKITDYYDLKDYANEIKRYLKRNRINTQLIEYLIKDMRKHKAIDIDEYIFKKFK